MENKLDRMDRKANQVKMPHNGTPLQDIKRVLATLKNHHIQVTAGQVRLYYNGAYCAGFVALVGNLACDLMWSDPEFGRHELKSYDATSFLSGLDALTTNRVLGTKMIKNKEVPDVLKSARWYVDLELVSREHNTKSYGLVTEVVPLVKRVEKVASFREVES